MLQIDFLKEILEKCQAENIHTAVDTAGHVPWGYFEAINPFVDVYLYDIKAIDSDRHKKLTGLDNDRILSNYKKLIEVGKQVIVRFPYVVGANEDQIHKMVDFLNQYRPDLVEVLPYHNLGIGKQAYLKGQGQVNNFTAPDPEVLDAFKLQLRAKGLCVK